MAETFKCGVHDFGTDDLDAFNEHLSALAHTTEGIAPCNMCGLSTSFKFTGKKGIKAPALCSACASSILGGSQ